VYIAGASGSSEKDFGTKVRLATERSIRSLDAGCFELWEDFGFLARGLTMAAFAMSASMHPTGNVGR